MEQPISLEHSDHPLNNSLILQKIFGYLGSGGTVEDLKNARLVSNASHWQEELQKVWRREAVLVLCEKGVLETPIRRGGISVLDYVLLLGNPDSPYGLRQVPFERVALKYMRINLVVARADGLAKTFWDALGPSTRHLELNSVVLEQTGEGYEADVIKKEDILQFLRSTLPNLESLTLKEVRDMRIDDQENVYLGDVMLPSITKLCVASGGSMGLNLNSLPNLRELKLIEYVKIAPLLNNVTQHSSLQLLDMIDCQGVEYFQNINSDFATVDFSSLCQLKVNAHTEDLNDTRALVTSNRNTLQKLEIFRWIGDQVHTSPIVAEMPMLTQLSLWGNVVGDLSFLRFTPNLERLHLDAYGLEKMIEMKQEIQYAENPMSFQTGESLFDPARLRMDRVVLYKLEYCQLNVPLGVQYVGLLAQWMPNLRTLKCVVDSLAFQEVCAAWIRLETLECLTGSSLTNKDFVDGLASLTGLKRFVYTPECNTTLLNDDCVANGILKLGELDTLDLNVTEEFSEQAERLLREKIRQVKLYRGHDPDASCCVQTAYKHYIFEIEGRASAESSSVEEQQ